MSAYSSGSVNVRIGSSSVTGNNTNFNIYVTAGDYFSLNESKTFYEVGSVTSASELTLTSRYADATYESNRASEHFATTNDASLAYTGVLSYTPVILSSVTVDASDVTWADDGAGVLATTSGGSLGAAGTISYDDGSITVNFNASANASININASYHSGDSRNAMPYRIVKDFTNYYNFLEMGDNDRDFPRIFTKSMRLIDAALYNASIDTATINVAYAATLTTNNLDATTADISIGHIDTLTASDINATTGNITTLVSNSLTATTADIDNITASQVTASGIYTDGGGKIGVGTSAPTTYLHISGDKLRVDTAKTPSSATAEGDIGDICWDASYLYVCASADTWVRSALSTW